MKRYFKSLLKLAAVFGWSLMMACSGGGNGSVGAATTTDTLIKDSLDGVVTPPTADSGAVIKTSTGSDKNNVLPDSASIAK